MGGDDRVSMKISEWMIKGVRMRLRVIRIRMKMRMVMGVRMREEEEDERLAAFNIAEGSQSLLSALINTRYHAHLLLMLAQTPTVFRVCGICLWFLHFTYHTICVCVCVFLII